MTLAVYPDFRWWQLAEAPIIDMVCKWTKIPGASQLAPGKYKLDVKNTDTKEMLGMRWSRMKWRKWKAMFIHNSSDTTNRPYLTGKTF